MESAWKEIEAVLQKYERAVKKGDVEALLALHTDDVAAFDLMLPFDYNGKTTLRERLTEWINSYEPGIEFHFREKGIVARGELAVCHALVHSVGDLKVGETSEMWMRSTLALRKSNGHWQIFHEHMSDPIDMKTGTAVFERSA